MPRVIENWDFHPRSYYSIFKMANFVNCSLSSPGYLFVTPVAYKINLKIVNSY